MASSPEINQWNEGWRSSELYAQALQSVGADPSKPIKLSDAQRKQLQAFIQEQTGFEFPKGVEIDPAGNMNENEGFGKQAKRWGPIVAAAAITAFGIPGVMPGLFGGIGTGGAAASTAGSSVVGTTAGGAPIFSNAGSALMSGMIAPAAAGAIPAAASLAGGGGVDEVVNVTAGGSTGGNIFGKIWDKMKGNVPDLIGAGVRGVGAAAQAAAQNRGAQFEADVAAAQLKQQAERDFYEQTLAREGEGRNKQRNAWEMLHRAAYVTDAPQNINKTMLSKNSVALAGPSEEQRSAAAGVRGSSAQQLAEGNTLPTPQRVGTDVKLQGPGAFERIGGIVGGAGSVLTGYTPGAYDAEQERRRRYPGIA